MLQISSIGVLKLIRYAVSITQDLESRLSTSGSSVRLLALILRVCHKKCLCQTTFWRWARLAKWRYMNTHKDKEGTNCLCLCLWQCSLFPECDCQALKRDVTCTKNYILWLQYQSLTDDLPFELCLRKSEVSLSCVQRGGVGGSPSARAYNRKLGVSLVWQLCGSWGCTLQFAEVGRSE